MPEDRRSELAALMDAGPGDDETRRLVVLFTGLVRDPHTAAAAIEEAHARDLDPAKVLELTLQSFLFAGFPRCINALTAYRRVYGAEPGGGPPRLTKPDDLEPRRRRGEALFRRIYADWADRVLDDLARYHEDLRDWILLDGYGKILARPALDARVRELAAVAALIVSGDTRQLSSHMRGAVHCGATPEEVHAAVRIARPFAEAAAHVEAVKIAERLFPPGRR